MLPLFAVEEHRTSNIERRTSNETHGRDARATSAALVGSFFPVEAQGWQESAVLTGRMKNDKWVRLVIFCFHRDFNHGWTRMNTDGGSGELNLEVCDDGFSAGRRKVPARRGCSLFELRNGFVIVWRRSGRGRWLEDAFSFFDGDVHDDGGGDVFAEATALETFELVHGAVELALQRAFVADDFFQEFAGRQQGD